MLQRRSMGLFFGVACLLASCSSGGGDGGGPFCAQTTNKLRSCGLVTEGELPGCQEPEEAVERCELNCYLNASCDELRVLMCTDAAPTGLVACFIACPQGGEFQCATGNEVVDIRWQCDGEPDCTDGSDEVGCPTFTCASGGETVRAAYQCDGTNDCSDGSDEVGCTGFTCASDGRTIPAHWQCDGEPDCADDTDEADCPPIAEIVCD